MALYVDDLLIIIVIIVVVEELKKVLYREFKIKDFGEVEVIIDMYIRRNRETKILLIS